VLFEALKDTTKAIDVESNIAIVYKNIGLYEKSLEVAFRQLARLNQKKPTRALASCYNTIALVYEDTEEYDDAIAYHREALRVRKEIGYQAGEGHSFHNIGEAYRNKGQYDSARANLQRALKIKNDLNDKSGTSSTLNSLGRTYVGLGKLTEAEKYFNDALAIATQYKDKPTQSAVLNDLADIKLRNKEYGLSEQYLKRALLLAEEAKQIESVRNNLTLQVQLFTRSGQFQKAVMATQQLSSLKDSLLNSEKAKIRKSLEIAYETDLREQQIAMLEQQSQINQAKLAFRETQVSYQYFGLTLLGLIVGLVYYNYRSARKSKQRIETLHKELHHRVKNNLQILSSILTLQANQLSDEEARNAAKSTESRINAMALIHRKLYKTDNHRTIELREYIQEIVNFLAHAHGFEHNTFRAEVEVPVLHLDVDKAIPSGLILNELISNAFKHAFPKLTDPVLSIRASITNSRLLLVVADNGPGLPANSGTNPSESFGLKIVASMLRELKGNFQVNNANGTEYKIDLPIT